MTHRPQPRLRPVLRSGLAALLLCAALTVACDDTGRADGAAALPTATAAGEAVPGLWRPGALAGSDDGRTVFIAELATRRVRAFDLDTAELRTILDVVPRDATPTFDERRWDTGFGQALFSLSDGRLLLAGSGRALLLLDPDGVEEPIAVGHERGGVAPADGVTLGDVDLSTLQGITRVEGRNDGTDELVLLLAGRLWRARPLLSAAVGTTGSELLASARLEALAGDGTFGRGASVGDALQVPLELVPGRWEGVLADASGRVLFVESDRLRLVQDGRIVTVTGTGSVTGATELSFEDFGSSFTRAPSSRAVWHDGAPHFVDNKVLRRFDIIRVDLDAGEVEGLVRPASGEIPEMGGVASMGERLFATFGTGGTLLELTPGPDRRPGLEPVFGPLEDWFAERYGIEIDLDEEGNPVEDDPHDPYRLGGLLLPQAVTSFAGGEFLLVNQPLARLLSSIDRSQAPGAVPPGLEAMCAVPDSPDALATCPVLMDATSHGPGSWPMASDNRLALYVVHLGTLGRIELGAGEAGQTRISSLRAPVASGIPGPGRDVILQTAPTLHATDDAIVLALDGLIARYAPATGWIEHEIGPPRGVSPLRRPKPRTCSDDRPCADDATCEEGVCVPDVPERARAPFFALDIRELHALAVDDGGLRLVAVSDPEMPDSAVLAAGSATLAARVAGVEVPANLVLAVLGGGSEPLAAGVHADAVRLDAIDALAWLPRPDGDDGQPRRAVLAAVRADDGSGTSAPALVTVDEDRLVTPLPGVCGAPPGRAGWLGTLSDAAGAPQLVLVQAHAPRGEEDGERRALWACRVPGTESIQIANQPLEEDVWTELDEAASRLPPALSGTTLVRYDDHRGLPVVWLHEIGDASSPPRRHDLVLGREERVEAIAARLGGADLFVAVDGPDGRLLLEGRVPGREVPGSTAAALPSLSWVAGGGQALASGLPAGQAALGEVVDSLAVGPDGSLYAAMRDTAALWRVDAGDDGVPGLDDPAQLLWFGAPLFEVGGAGPYPVAIGGQGEVWVGNGDAIYSVREGMVRRVAGGQGELRERAPALEASIGQVRGLASEGTTLYALTDRALFAIEAPGTDAARLRLLSRDGELVLADGTKRPLDEVSVVTPSLVVGRPGELLLASPGRHEIVSVPTDWRP